MSLIIIKLNADAMNILNEEKCLRKTPDYTLSKGQNYGFYSHRKLYGLYRVKYENPKYYFLSKNYYRPLRLFGSDKIKQNFLSQSHWVEETWKARNHLRDRLLMLSSEDAKNFYFTFYHHLLSNFKKTLTLNKTSELLEIISQAQNLLLSHHPHSLSELKGLGSRIFQLGKFKEITPILTHRVTYSPSPPPLPLEILYHPEFQNSSQGSKGAWVWGENLIHYFHSPNHPRRRLHNFTAFHTNEDRFMVEESNALKQIWKSKPNFSAQFLTGNQNQLLAQAMTGDILHLIAHGEEVGDEDFRFLSKSDRGEVLLTLEDIRQFPQTPPLVFLSNCYSNHPQLRKAFFNRGTQTLITSQGPLFSSHLPKVIGDFYRRLLVEKMTVEESFYLMIKKLIHLNDINALKLRLHGYGKERLYSFKH